VIVILWLKIILAIYVKNEGKVPIGGKKNISTKFVLPSLWNTNLRNMDGTLPKLCVRGNQMKKKLLQHKNNRRSRVKYDWENIC